LCIVHIIYAKASNGKEFRDSINFSTKRWHKIGTLMGASAAPSQDERAKKRQRLVEEQLVEQVIQESKQTVDTAAEAEAAPST
jgi:hypothetical protein